MEKNNQIENNEKSLLKGEYLSLMASIDYHLALVITEYLGIENHSQVFEDWLLNVPISFGCKVDLFEAVIKEDTQLNQFRSLLNGLRSLWGYRNLLVHSFGNHLGLRTSRGEDVPTNKITTAVLKSRIGQARKIEDLLTYTLACFQQGTPPPCSSDDFADAPL